MHRFLAFLLSALLLLGLSLPAMAAAETADARLARVTQAVKDTLDLDTEAFTDFHGDVYEQELGTVWTLNWSGGGSSLNIEALEDGTVVSYWRNDSDSDIYSYGSELPVLPKLDTAAAMSAANAFLSRVLDAETERVSLEEPKSSGQLNSTVCRFSGTILLNGLPSPLSYSIAVRGSDNAVTSFRRDAAATSFLGGIPSAKPAVSSDDAAKTLRDTLKMELIYVVSEENENRAVLRYVPKDYEPQYVDAQTGKLVTPDAEVFYGNGSSAATMDAAVPEADESAKRSLTAAELSGVEKLEGVQDSAALDKLLRAESAYRLENYTLSSSEFRLVQEGKDQRETVLCTMRYTLPEEDGLFTGARTFTVDARSGKVRGLYGYGRWDKDVKSAVSASDAQRAAEGFLPRFTDRAAEFALYRSEDNTAEGAPFYRFTFARKANGIFFPANSCTLEIDRVSGAVAGISYTYDESISFDSASGLVEEAKAIDAWMATYDVTLAYRSRPKELDASVAAEAKLIGLGYTRFRALLLSYGLERETYSPGIDAKTRKPVTLKADAYEIAYTDTAKHWAAKEISTLAGYGIGYDSESFRPDQALTQWELAALLASARGMRVDPDNAEPELRDSVYETVYRMGMLKRDERRDDAPVTRAQLVRYLLDSAGFGPVARLNGIFTCSFADRDAIPADDLGYAALAQGFGIVTNGSFNGSGASTRAIAAVMLCRLMQR